MKRGSWPLGMPRPAKAHDVARLHDRFESRRDTRARRAALAATLGRGEGAHKALSRTLGACKAGRACGSAACPVCCRRFRRWLVGEILKLHHELGGNWYAVTLVSPALKREPGTLIGLDVAKTKDWLRTRIIRAGLGHLTMIGGLDISYNENGDGQWRTHWQPHFYLLVRTEDRGQLKRALAGAFRADRTIPRPVRIRPLVDVTKAASYLWKSMFFRRVSYRDDRGQRRTRGLSLKASATRELALLLDHHSPTDRLFLRKVRKRGWRLAAQ